MDEFEELGPVLGPVRRWLDEDGILHAENDFILLTWAPTDDPALDGTFSWYGPKQIGVELMLRPKFEAACRINGLCPPV